MKKQLREAVSLIQRHWRGYVAINVAYYGLILVGMLVIVCCPELQQTLLKNVKHGLDDGPLRVVKSAYAGGHVFPAMGLTFAVNLFAGSFMTITLPSMLVPFSGLLTGLGRAAAWGLVMSPVDPGLRWVMIPHSLTLLLEGQAYVVAMFAAFRLGLGVLRPHCVEAATVWQGYRAGLRDTVSLYWLVTLLLGIAAVYEALECIYLAPLLKR